VYLLLWDASALAQRYAPEVGHQTVNALLAATARAQMATTILTYSETCAALVRKRNQGALDTAIFTVARSSLQAEVIDDPDFAVLALEFADFLDGIELIDRHNLNSADASVLAALLSHARAQPTPTNCVWSPRTPGYFAPLRLKV
jgi:predicted nucleic acid-binding protein